MLSPALNLCQSARCCEGFAIQHEAFGRTLAGLSQDRACLSDPAGVAGPLYSQPSVEIGAGFLKHWYFRATHSRLPPMIDAARTVKHHWDGILRWFDSKIANGLIEGINSLVQAAKAKARGYRSTRNLTAIV